MIVLSHPDEPSLFSRGSKFISGEVFFSRRRFSNPPLEKGGCKQSWALCNKPSTGIPHGPLLSIKAIWVRSAKRKGRIIVIGESVTLGARDLLLRLERSMSYIVHAKGRSHFV